MGLLCTSLGVNNPGSETVPSADLLGPSGCLLPCPRPLPGGPSHLLWPALLSPLNSEHTGEVRVPTFEPGSQHPVGVSVFKLTDVSVSS